MLKACMRHNSTIQGGRKKGKKSEINEEVFDEIQSRIMSKIDELISEKVNSILDSRSSNFSIGDEKKITNMETEPTSSNEGHKEQEEPISYEDALEKLGGVKTITEYKGLSDGIKASLIDSTLMKEIDKLLPPSVDRLARSTRHINQSYVADIDELFETSENVFPSFKHLIEGFAEKTNSMPMIPKLKSKERASAKAAFKYRGDNGTVANYRLNDIVRATVVFATIHDLYKGLEEAITYFTVKEFNDRYQEPLDGGYRDIQLVIDIDGYMCELQLTTGLILRAKKYIRPSQLRSESASCCSGKGP